MKLMPVTMCAVMLAAASVVSGQQPGPKAGPCTAPGWIGETLSRNNYGETVHVFTNVGPYPLFLDMAVVQASGNFAPRAYNRSLAPLKIGESTKVNQPRGGFAYRFNYVNMAYLNFATGVFTRCSDSLRHVLTLQLPDVCRAASAAQSCLDQANREIADDAKRRPL